MSATTRLTIAWMIAACLCGGSAIAAGEDSLPAAKELYGAAAYHDALDMLDRLKVTSPPADAALEIEKYRAFCLFAMGNTRDATVSVTIIVTTWPRFRLDEREASPRVVAAFREVRQAQLPALAEQAYARGRDAYEASRTGEAVEQFRLVLDLANDPDAPADQPLFKDMRTLASGFLDLVEAAKAAADAKAAAIAETPPPPAPAPVIKPYYTVDDADVIRPVAISQELPPWPSSVRVVNAKGVIDLLINQKGEVEAATMRAHLHPEYDALLVARAKAWRYHPAMRNGEPVKYLKRIEITAP